MPTRYNTHGHRDKYLKEKNLTLSSKDPRWPAGDSIQCPLE